MKEEMLADVASPAITPGLRLKTEQKIQARVKNGADECSEVRLRQLPSGVWSCLYSTPFRISRPIYPRLVRHFAILNYGTHDDDDDDDPGGRR
jgi:hypothetical protein